MESKSGQKSVRLMSVRQDMPRKVSELQVLRVVATTFTAKVLLCSVRANKSHIIAKRIDVRSGRINEQQVRQEIEIHEALDHDNIMAQVKLDKLRNPGCTAMRRPYGVAADIWAVGILTYELLVGGPPFESQTKEETWRKIVEEKPFIPAHLSPEAQNFIQQALCKDAELRPTAEGLALHKWLQS
ncbi:hypothetical protein WJX73_005654 [Symbiochloris irregularis]|uniref:Protein kinase domain-containing protein n=1 Tax=Symbiochloris irregularis TaxID=706552 RepID=A0AAW1P2A4_9CHLO